MADSDFKTQDLHDVLDRWRGGDRDAANDLCLRVGRRLEVLGRKMLGGFPNVRSVADTGDVVQNALIRLLSTLRGLRPESTRDFFNLAAVHLRRELLDLSRRVAARPDLRRRSANPVLGNTTFDTLEALPDSSADADLERWCSFHEAVDALPVAEREVMSLAFYHGFTHVKIAELFQVDERTIRLRWKAAVLQLNRILGGDIPIS